MYKCGFLIFIHFLLVSIIFARSVRSFENKTDRVVEHVISAKALCASIHCGRGQECLHRKFWCMNPPCPSMLYCSSTRREAQKGPISCESVRCSKGYICLVRARKCHWDQRCRIQIARCVSEREYHEGPASCVDIQCAVGQQCILKESPCVQPPCKLVRNCEKKKDVQMWHSRCRKLECPSEYECFVRRPPENCSSTEPCKYTSDCMTANIHEFSPNENCPGWVCPRHQTCLSTIPKSCDPNAGIENCQAKRTCRGSFTTSNGASSSSPKFISSTPTTVAKTVGRSPNATKLPAPKTTKAIKRNLTRQNEARKGSPQNTWRDRALITTTINPFPLNNLNAVTKVLECFEAKSSARFQDSDTSYHRQYYHPLYPVNRLTSPVDNPALVSTWNQTNCNRNNNGLLGNWSVQFETWKPRRTPIYQTPIYVRSIVIGNNLEGGKFPIREEPTGSSVTEWLDHLRLKTGVDAMDVWAKQAEENRGYKEFNEWLASVENALGPVQFEIWFREIKKLASEYRAFQNWLANQVRTSSGARNKTNSSKATGYRDPPTPRYQQGEQSENPGQKFTPERPTQMSGTSAGAANKTLVWRHEIPQNPRAEAKDRRIEDPQQITDPEKHFRNFTNSQRVPSTQLDTESNVENFTKPTATTNAIAIPYTPEVTTLPQRSIAHSTPEENTQAKKKDSLPSGRRTDSRPPTNNRRPWELVQGKNATHPEIKLINQTVQSKKPQQNLESGTLTGSEKNNSVGYQQDHGARKNVGTQTTQDEPADSSLEQHKNFTHHLSETDENISREKSPNAETPEEQNKNVGNESFVPHIYNSTTSVEKETFSNRNASTEPVTGDVNYEATPDLVKVNDSDEFSLITTTFAPKNIVSPFDVLFKKNGDPISKVSTERLSTSTERNLIRQKDRGGPPTDLGSPQSPMQQHYHKTLSVSDQNSPEIQDKDDSRTRGKEDPTKMYNLFAPAEDEFHFTSPWDILGVLDPEKRTYYSLVGFSPEQVDNQVQIIRYPLILSRPAVGDEFNTSFHQNSQNVNARPNHKVHISPNSESFLNQWKFNPSERWVPILPRQQLRPRELGPNVPDTLDPGIIPLGESANFKSPLDQPSQGNAGKQKKPNSAVPTKDTPRIDKELPQVLFIDALLENFQEQLKPRDQKDKIAREYFILQTRNGQDEPYFTPLDYSQYKFHPSIFEAEYPSPIVIPLQNLYPNRITPQQLSSAKPYKFFNPSSINGAVLSTESPRISAFESGPNPSPQDYMDAYIDFFIEDAFSKMIFHAPSNENNFRYDQADPERISSPSQDSSANNAQEGFGNLEDERIVDPVQQSQQISKSSAETIFAKENSNSLKTVQSTAVTPTDETQTGTRTVRPNLIIELIETKEEKRSADCKGEKTTEIPTMVREDEESSILMETYRPYSVDDELVEYYYADSEQPQEEEEEVEEESLKFQHELDRKMNESIHESDYYNDQVYDGIIPEKASELFPQPHIYNYTKK